MAESDAGGLLVVGRICGCYGIRGWVKVRAYTEPQENFLKLGGWMLQRGGGFEPIEFDAGRPHGKGLVAHIAGVDDRTAAESFRGLEVAVAADSLPPLVEGDYYWRQLLGLKVWCREGAERVLLGQVDHLIETGANDVLVVAPCPGSVDSDERLIPYLPGDVVALVDLEEGLLEVDWFVHE